MGASSPRRASSSRELVTRVRFGRTPLSTNTTGAPTRSRSTTEKSTTLRRLAPWGRVGTRTNVAARANARTSASRRSSSRLGGQSTTTRARLRSRATAARQSPTTAAATGAGGCRPRRERSCPQVINDPWLSRSRPAAATPSSSAATSKLLATVLFPTPPLGPRTAKILRRHAGLPTQLRPQRTGVAQSCNCTAATWDGIV